MPTSLSSSREYWSRTTSRWLLILVRASSAKYFAKDRNGSRLRSLSVKSVSWNSTAGGADAAFADSLPAAAAADAFGAPELGFDADDDVGVAVSAAHASESAAPKSEAMTSRVIYLFSKPPASTRRWCGTPWRER